LYGSERGEVVEIVVSWGEKCNTECAGGEFLCFFAGDFVAFEGSESLEEEFVGFPN
jgi:hypothetical protein